MPGKRIAFRTHAVALQALCFDLPSGYTQRPVQRPLAEKWERAYLHCVLLFVLDVLLLDLLLLLEDLLVEF